MPDDTGMVYTVNKGNQYRRVATYIGGTWVTGSNIEIPCIYHIYAAKTRKNYIRKNLENKGKN